MRNPKFMKLRKPMFAETKLKFKENVLNNTKKKKKNRLKPKYF